MLFHCKFNQIAPRKKGGSLEAVEWMKMESAFKNSIRTGIIKNLKHVDVVKFLPDALPVAEKKIRDTMRKRNLNMKVYTVLTLKFVLEKIDGHIEELKHFNTKSFPIFQTTNIEKDFTDEVISTLLHDIEEFLERDSGWTLQSIEFFNVIMSKYNPLQASSYIPLPKQIHKKNACINVRNNDDRCFKWAILCALVTKKGYKINHPENLCKI